MSTTRHIGDAFTWFFNLLTFLAAVGGFYGLTHFFIEDWELFKGIDDVVFALVLLSLTGGIVWKTGKWLFSSPRKIETLLLLMFWVPLILIFLVLFGYAMGSVGLGSSQ